MVEAPLVVQREAQEVAAHRDREEGKSSAKLARIRRPMTTLKHRSGALLPTQFRFLSPGGDTSFSCRTLSCVSVPALFVVRRMLC